MRIALFTYATQPRGGVFHTVAVGDALHDLGQDVTIYALDEGSRGFFRAPRCAHVLVPIDPPRGDVLAYVKHGVAAYVEAWDPATPAFDVYHAQDGISANALATLAERGDIPGYVRTVHHLDDFGPGELGALQERSIRGASDWFVVSELWRGRLARSFGIDAARVPNGVDAARFTPVAAPQRERRRAALGFGPGPLYVAIGGIEARKNTLATLEAFALVRAQQPAAQLAIAGGASVLNHSAYRRAFEARAAELGTDGIAILGVLPDSRIVELLQAADALVFPSLVEGFGLVILEALACATPVITSAIAPFTEFLSSADALLVDPEDPAAIAGAMHRARDPEIVRATALRGPELAKRFTWEASARAHLARYAAPAATSAASGEVLHA